MGTRYQGTETEVRALGAFVTLMRATSSVTGAIQRLSAFGDLTQSQFAVLEALLHVGPLSQRAIAKKILRSSGNLVTVIDNLERDGLVQRRRSTEDRRVVHVHLTDAGRSRIEAIMPSHVAAIVDAMAVLDPEEQETLQRLCRRLGLAQAER